ncbi:hypothetical protein HDU96_000365 [Phlyctochytrium bullatum]|nr:hypothetical protein HDU96_000365 [Phlyctochytrium bullatum]
MTVAAAERVQLIDLDHVNVNIVVEMYKVLVRFLGPDFAARPASTDPDADSHAGDDVFRVTISVPQHQTATCTVALMKVAAAVASKDEKVPPEEPRDSRPSSTTAESETVTPQVAKKGRVSADGPNLHDAVACSDVAMVTELLRKNHDPCQRDVDGRLPIDLCSSQAISSALAVGMQVRAHDVFVKAVEDGDMATVGLFLAAGASSALKSSAGMPAVHTAVIKEKGDVLQAMLDVVADIRAIVDLKADVAIFDADNDEWIGLTPLQAASVLGKEQTAKILLERGADVEALAHNERSRTALHIAAIRGHAGVFKLLLDQGASLWPVDKVGDTPLHLAAWKGNLEICRTILDRDATEIDMKGENGNTALHLAVEENHLEVAEVLLSFGASLQLRRDDGNTPVDLAREKTPLNQRMFTLLVETAKKAKS